MSFKLDSRQTIRDTHILVPPHVSTTYKSMSILEYSMCLTLQSLYSTSVLTVKNLQETGSDNQYIITSSCTIAILMNCKILFSFSIHSGLLFVWCDEYIKTTCL